MEEYEVQEGDSTIYSGDGQEESLSDDEISPQEEAFMRGYEKASEIEEEKSEEEEE